MLPGLPNDGLDLPPVLPVKGVFGRGWITVTVELPEDQGPTVNEDWFEKSAGKSALRD